MFREIGVATAGSSRGCPRRCRAGPPRRPPASWPPARHADVRVLEHVFAKPSAAGPSAPRVGVVQLRADAQGIVRRGVDRLAHAAPTLRRSMSNAATTSISLVRYGPTVTCINPRRPAVCAPLPIVLIPEAGCWHDKVPSGFLFAVKPAATSRTSRARNTADEVGASRPGETAQEAPRTHPVSSAAQPAQGPRPAG